MKNTNQPFDTVPQLASDEPSKVQLPVTEEVNDAFTYLVPAQTKAMVGTEDTHVAALRFNEVLNSIALPSWVTQEEVPALKQSIASMLEAMAPQDEFEVLLIQQMICAHFASIGSFRNAWRDSLSIEVRDLYLKHAKSMSDLYSNLLAKLDKHRRRGGHEVKVTYVHVDDGGQAIVGDVDASPSRGAKPHNPLSS